MKYKSKAKSAILKKYKDKIEKAIYSDWGFNEGLNIDLVEEIIKEFSVVSPKIN